MLYVCVQCAQTALSACLLSACLLFVANWPLRTVQSTEGRMQTVRVGTATARFSLTRKIPFVSDPTAYAPPWLAWTGLHLGTYDIICSLSAVPRSIEDALLASRALLCYEAVCCLF